MGEGWGGQGVGGRRDPKRPLNRPLNGGGLSRKMSRFRKKGGRNTDEWKKKLYIYTQ